MSMETGVIVALAPSVLVLIYMAAMAVRTHLKRREQRRRSNQAMALKYSRIRREEEMKRLGLEDRAWS